MISVDIIKRFVAEIKEKHKKINEPTIEKDFYLKNKIMVMPIRSELPPKPLNPSYYNDLYANAAEALAQTVNAAGMLANNPSQVQYNLSATLIDVQDPRCFFGTCETGSTIKYELKKGERVVYDEMLVVPQNNDYPAFGADMVYVIREASGAALGNNFAHLIHVLSTKTQGDIK